KPDEGAQPGDDHGGADPGNDRIDDPPHEVVDGVQVVALADEVGVAGERAEQKDLQEQAVGDEVAGQGDDERRQVQSRDQDALDHGHDDDHRQDDRQDAAIARANARHVSADVFAERLGD